MKNLFTIILLFTVTVCLYPISNSYAKTGYVSDVLLLTFRQQPNNSSAVIKTLTSNTPVVILEEIDGFYKVELTSKEIGFVDKNFIIFTLPKTLIINQLKKENAILMDKLAKSESNIKVFQDQIASMAQNYTQTKIELEASLKTTEDENNQTAKQLADIQKTHNDFVKQSKNIQTVLEENKKFKKQNEILSEDLALFKDKNSSLLKTGMIKWFLSGAVVLLLGWIIGQSVSSKKQHSSSLIR